LSTVCIQRLKVTKATKKKKVTKMSQKNIAIHVPATFSGENNLAGFSI
jgi:hypothetical protein